MPLRASLRGHLWVPFRNPATLPFPAKQIVAVGHEVPRRPRRRICAVHRCALLGARRISFLLSTGAAAQLQEVYKLYYRMVGCFITHGGVFHHR